MNEAKAREFFEDVRKLHSPDAPSVSSAQAPVENRRASQLVGSGDLFGQIERLIKQKGRLQLSHDEGGGGMGYYFCATVGGEWPSCSSSTPEGALRVLVWEHLRLEREALQKRITEIDGSASL